MEETIRWLLEGEPWVQYRTRVDILEQSENEAEVLCTRKEMINHQRIQSMLAELTDWPVKILSSHKSAGQSFHKLSFIADLGFRRDDSLIDEIVGKIYEHVSDEGPFQLPTNVPRHYGGSGSTVWAWALCDAPTIVYSLIKFGLEKDAKVQEAVRYLAGLVRENGWPCTVSKELGRFRGPGRKDDPCPYATLVTLKMLSQLDGWRDSREARIGSENLLRLWEESKKTHPYTFYMGTDFRRIKAPFIWYDILHILDVLSQFRWLSTDGRMREMMEIVISKADDRGRYIPESEWQAWKEWDFGQKKHSSRWLTFLILRILKRANLCQRT